MGSDPARRTSSNWPELEDGADAEPDDDAEEDWLPVVLLDFVRPKVIRQAGPSVRSGRLSHGARPRHRVRALHRDVLGAVIGGVAGGVVGSQVGRGSERTVATIGGTIVGVLIVGLIGRSMDEADQACVAQILEQAPAQHAIAWSNPDGGHYRVVPLEGYQDG